VRHPSIVKRRSQDAVQAFRDLVQRARTGGLRSSELSDPTITVTSLGEQGVEAVFERWLQAPERL
jgi:pyruvate dehydrogenase E2 component (dihydrolipoamide acetyltransferase)